MGHAVVAVREKPLNVPSAKVRVLFVSGFVVDTYSEIEKQYVELCARHSPDIEFVWLVPDISCRSNRFARAESRNTLREPVWVEHLRRANIPYIVGNISAFNPFSNFALFYRIFSQERVDAVYTHFGVERFWATLCGKLWRKVTIWNEHWHSLGTKYTAAKRLFYRLFVDEFIAVSEFIAATLPVNHKVRVVRNAIFAKTRTTLTPDERAAMRKRLGMPQTDTIVLLVSAFRPNKRHDLALEVCGKVLRKHPDAFFVFLGEGITRPSVHRRLEEMGVADRVHMPGHVDNVDDYYLVSDICMLTSLGEPCALAVVEAMKFAKPLVAFKSGGTPERIHDGRTGFLLEECDTNGFADVIVDLLENDAKRGQIGRNALTAVQEQADRNRWITELTSLLKDIVKGKKVIAGG